MPDAMLTSPPATRDAVTPTEPARAARPAAPVARTSRALAIWLSRVVRLIGLLDILDGVLPGGRSRALLLVEVLPPVGEQTARAATVAVGLLLVLLGGGLRRRKRRAWAIATVLAAAGVVLHLAKGLDVDAALLSGALLLLLLAARRQFRAGSDPHTRWRALGALLGLAAAGLGLGLAEVALRAHRLVGHPPVRLWVEHVALGLIGLPGPLRFSHPGADRAVALTTGALGLLAAGTALVLLLRPGGRRPGHGAAQAARLRALLAAHGEEDSLGYFALRHDKSLIWSASGKAAVAYRVLHGVSLASGDPLGDPEAWPGAIEAWLADATAHAWTPAVIGCGDRGGRAYARYGLDAVELGDEAVIDVSGFTLAGRPMRAVRQAVARVRRAGYRCTVVREGELPRERLEQVARLADRLRDGPVERGFSMALSRVGDPADADCVLALAEDAEGRLRGLLQFVPWGCDGLSLDLMRRDPAAGNGLVEFMVCAVLDRAPGLGVRRVSLNFAVLRAVFARADRLGAGFVLRGWHRLLRAASRFWQIESLYRANAKYQPAWVPRYLCFPGVRDLPRIGLAVLRAEALVTPPRPYPRRWVRGRRTEPRWG